MRRFLIVLAGARPDILSRCPTDSDRFVGVGGAVLLTSLLASVSMTFALVSALGVNLVVAVTSGLMWGLFVLSLDRWMVASLSLRGPGRFMIVLPRVLLSLLMGIVIATPLVLHIFEPEIDARIAVIQQERSEAFQQKLAEGDLGTQIARLTEVVRELRNVINSAGATGIDPARDPKLTTLLAARTEAQREADRYYDEWQCQLYGGESCPVRGNGVQARKAQEGYQAARSRLDTLTRQIDDRRRHLSSTGEQAKRARLAEATADLPGYQDQLDRRLEQRTALRANFDADNHSSSGLLLRLQALDELSASDGTLYAVMLLLFLFLTLIECLPVAVKLMQRPGVYEQILAEHERRALREFEARLASQDHDGDQVTLEEVWEREAHQPEQREQPVIPAPAADEEDRQAQEDRELRTMRDARAPAGPRPADGGDG
ncbi:MULTISPECIES: DUF4407 domain-containing protein [unclassified Nonomuraea]|uniref:DUF4407 domain-containing protein n=1 Tax=unclassified Nonomuraea TaxID=2593643 RepID=UPI0033FB8274